MRTIISAIAVLLLSACGSPNNEDQAAPAAQQVPAPAPASVKVNAIGEVTAGPGYEFTLNSVEERAKPSNSPYAHSAGDGQVYVVAKFTFKNTGTKPVDNSSFPKVELVDAIGTAYSSDLVASVFASDDGSIDDLNPGVARRNALAWKVAKGAFDPAVWKVVLRSDPPVEFKLK